ncbi:unnamed protein product [Rotaria socialis]|uniref:Fe2OG dioxygenase domain-containing protein n=1 Tax=Rotaria socialis TaxID=392032 RepID=A0A817MV32_9BILA|nr:unnamed protein product [Rotaria socialis]
MWMQEALDRFDQANSTALISKINILNNLAHATAQQGNIEHALAVTEEILSIGNQQYVRLIQVYLLVFSVLDPENVEAKKNKIHYESLIKKRTLVVEEQQNDSTVNSLKEHEIQYVSMNNKNFQVKNQRPGTYLELKSRQPFEQLCRQQHAQLSPKRQATLFCRYRHNKHPYLIFRPVKEEQVLDEPGIFLFHDVVSDSDIEKIKALAVPRLQRALIRNAATNTMTPADYRISKSTWLRDEDSPVIARLSQLISALTNLTMETAEEIHVVNYGVGGYYSPHLDFYHKWENPAYFRKAGNRIATWMTYMSDVERGGATVFPLSGGHVVPKKGSTVFWYNLNASGEADYRTLHAACPVLIGNKWVATKWIHEYGQEFRRRCSLDPMV